MRRLFSVLAVSFIALLSIGQLMADSTLATLVKARRMIDPRTGNVLSPVAVLIEGNRISKVGPPP